MTTKADIREWFKQGIIFKHLWMIVVTDTFEYDDYPIYADTVKEFDTKYEEHNGVNMQIIMEVYDLNGDMNYQLNIPRTFEFPPDSRFKAPLTRHSSKREVEAENELITWLKK